MTCSNITLLYCDSVWHAVTILYYTVIVYNVWWLNIINLWILFSLQLPLSLCHVVTIVTLPCGYHRHNVLIRLLPILHPVYCDISNVTCGNITAVFTNIMLSLPLPLSSPSHPSCAVLLECRNHSVARSWIVAMHIGGELILLGTWTMPTTSLPSRRRRWRMCWCTGVCSCLTLLHVVEGVLVCRCVFILDICAASCGGIGIQVCSYSWP